MNKALKITLSGISLVALLFGLLIVEPGDWLAEYPDSKILSTDTGYSRDYMDYSYGNYYTFPGVKQADSHLKLRKNRPA